MPPRAAKLAIGYYLNARIQLLLHQRGDFLVFNLGQLLARVFAHPKIGAGKFQSGAAQIAAYGVGVQGKRFAHDDVLLFGVKL